MLCFRAYSKADLDLVRRVRETRRALGKPDDRGDYGTHHLVATPLLEVATESWSGPRVTGGGRFSIMAKTARFAYAELLQRLAGQETLTRYPDHLHVQWTRLPGGEPRLVLLSQRRDEAADYFEACLARLAADPAVTVAECCRVMPVPDQEAAAPQPVTLVEIVLDRESARHQIIPMAQELLTGRAGAAGIQWAGAGIRNSEAWPGNRRTSTPPLGAANATLPGPRFSTRAGDCEPVRAPDHREPGPGGCFTLRLGEGVGRGNGTTRGCRFPLAAVREFMVRPSADALALLNGRDSLPPPGPLDQALHEALTRQDLEQAIRLIGEGADVNGLDARGRSPLAAAVNSSTPPSLPEPVPARVGLLPGLPEGGDLPPADGRDHAEIRAEAAIRLLLGRGADPNRFGFGGHPPLVHAARQAQPDLVRVLLAAGAEPNLNSDAEDHPWDSSTALANVVRDPLYPNPPSAPAPGEGGTDPVRTARRDRLRQVAAILEEAGARLNSLPGPDHPLVDPGLPAWNLTLAEEAWADSTGDPAAGRAAVRFAAALNTLDVRSLWGGLAPDARMDIFGWPEPPVHGRPAVIRKLETALAKAGEDLLRWRGWREPGLVKGSAIPCIFLHMRSPEHPTGLGRIVTWYKILEVGPDGIRRLLSFQGPPSCETAIPSGLFPGYSPGEIEEDRAYTPDVIRSPEELSIFVHLAPGGFDTPFLQKQARAFHEGLPESTLVEVPADHPAPSRAWAAVPRPALELRLRGRTVALFIRLPPTARKLQAWATRHGFGPVASPDHIPGVFPGTGNLPGSGFPSIPAVQATLRTGERLHQTLIGESQAPGQPRAGTMLVTKASPGTPLAIHTVTRENGPGSPSRFLAAFPAARVGTRVFIEITEVIPGQAPWHGLLRGTVAADQGTGVVFREGHRLEFSLVHFARDRVRLQPGRRLPFHLAGLVCKAETIDPLEQALFSLPRVSLSRRGPDEPWRAVRLRNLATLQAGAGETWLSQAGDGKTAHCGFRCRVEAVTGFRLQTVPFLQVRGRMFPLPVSDLAVLFVPVTALEGRPCRRGDLLEGVLWLHGWLAAEEEEGKTGTGPFNPFLAPPRESLMNPECSFFLPDRWP